MKKITLTSSILLITFCLCHAQSPGSLDNTFGIGGEVQTGFGGMYETAESVVIQSDGKIVVVGSSGKNFPARVGVIALARYNSSDGSLDNTFGSGGIVNMQFVDENFYYGRAAALQSDGKIVVVGHRCDTLTNTICSFVIARYNSNGSLENVWGNLAGMIGKSVALQTDGKIVAAGTSGSGTTLIRYNSIGSYDTGFGSGGIVTTAGGTGNSVAIQSDGKIVVAGGNGDFVTVRYNSDGSLDNTFGSGGIVTTDFGSSSEYCSSIVIQSDGKIVVVGSSDLGGGSSVVALARYESNGNLDNTFGTGGKVTTAAGTEGIWGNSVALQNDGKIVVGGTKSDNTTPGLPQSDFALVMYNSNGSLDNTFGTGGIATSHFYVGDNSLSLALQNDGKIVMAGYTGYTDGPYWEVARYNNAFSLGTEGSADSNELEFEIYPNPSSRIYTLNLKSKTDATKICVTDILGNCLLSKVSENDTNPTIDLLGQPKGIYFVEIVSSSERVMKKIVLE